MRAGISHWFNTPDRSQILSDAFGVPLCVYPDVAEEDSFSVTYLPINLPDKLSKNSVKIHLTGVPHFDSVVVNLCVIQFPISGNVVHSMQSLISVFIHEYRI
ncbi:hypothetical protein BDB01DRAFT_832663 [Pilobolus umbonatus]|nr:hypothetical protein BDB01DRAFT_832663 [Pilobolus umbonatus]